MSQCPTLRRQPCQAAQQVRIAPSMALQITRQQSWQPFFVHPALQDFIPAHAWKLLQVQLAEPTTAMAELEPNLGRVGRKRRPVELPAVGLDPRLWAYPV